MWFKVTLVFHDYKGLNGLLFGFGALFLNIEPLPDSQPNLLIVGTGYPLIPRLSQIFPDPLYGFSRIWNKTIHTSKARRSRFTALVMIFYKRRAKMASLNFFRKLHFILRGTKPVNSLKVDFDIFAFESLLNHEDSYTFLRILHTLFQADGIRNFKNSCFLNQSIVCPSSISVCANIVIGSRTEMNATGMTEMTAWTETKNALKLKGKMEWLW